MPACSAPSTLGRLACARSVRDAPISGSMADTCASKRRPGQASTRISTGWPGRTCGTACSSSAKLTLRVPASTRLAMPSPAARYCPSCTRRMPIVPANGARIAFCAMTASIPRSSPCAMSRAACAWSSCSCVATLSAINRRVRASTVSALRNCARSRRRSACSGASLSCTSSSPCFTRCPEVNAMRVTRPAVSAASSTCRAASSSPTPWNVRGARARSTGANATLVAGQPPAPSEPDEHADRPITLASARPRKAKRAFMPCPPTGGAGGWRSPLRPGHR
ncbi:hypothetical protein D9M69_334460 [compost metagenome]